MRNNSAQSNSPRPAKKQRRKSGKLIWQTTDKFNMPVHLTEETWEKHIKAKHPEVEPYVHEAKTVVETPHVVSADTKREDTKIFSKMGIGKGTRAREYLRAVVRYTDAGGRVATLFFDKTLPQGTIICGHKSTKV
jgi:hypothetical protein